MRWLKLTDTNGNPIFVNMALVLSMNVGNFCHTDWKNTRLYTGNIAMACEPGQATYIETYTIDVAELPEVIIEML